MTNLAPLTRDDISAAHDRIAGRVRLTPVIAPGDHAFDSEARLTLKLECLQHAGSFKARGAFNSLLAEPPPAAGVAAASGGNHGAAVAYAAQSLGVPARIFVPDISSPAKIALIRRYGAEIVVGGARYDDAQRACDAYVAESGAARIHPFAARATMAGQGTVAREWDVQTPDLDTVLVAVGGGGLIAGMASWWAGRDGRPVKVVGVEPAGSRALAAALEAGRPVDVDVQSIAADSLGAKNVGELVHAIARATADSVVLVPDEAIAEAQRRLWSDLRVAVEPGGAAALGALLAGSYRPAPGEHVGVLVCGANVDSRGLAALAV